MSSSASSSPSAASSSLASLKPSNYIRNRGLTNVSNMSKANKIGQVTNLASSMQSLGSASPQQNREASKLKFEMKCVKDSPSSKNSMAESGSTKSLVEKNIQKFGFSKLDARNSKSNLKPTQNFISQQIKSKQLSMPKLNSVSNQGFKTLQAEAVNSKASNLNDANLIKVQRKTSEGSQSSEEEDAQFSSKLAKTFSSEFQSMDEANSPTEYRSLQETCNSLEPKPVQSPSNGSSLGHSVFNKSPKLKENLPVNNVPPSISASSSSVTVSTNSSASSPSCTSPTSNKSQVVIFYFVCKNINIWPKNCKIPN